MKKFRGEDESDEEELAPEDREILTEPDSIESTTEV